MTECAGLPHGGVSHLLAVSGLHLALLCGLLGFGRKWKFYRPLILLRAAAALFYLLLTGMPVSVSRAGIVLLVALVGDFFLLPPDLLTSTSFAAILLGLQNAYAPCDLGFQLSFCAVLGVQAAAALTRHRAARSTRQASRRQGAMPSGRACANGSACQPCNAAGAGGPRHGGQPSRGALQPAGRLDGPARPAAGHPAAGVPALCRFWRQSRT